MTLSLISFSVQVLYGYLIRNFIFRSLAIPRYQRTKASFYIHILVGQSLWIFYYYNSNHNFMHCFRRRKKSLIYRLKKIPFQVLLFMKFNKFLIALFVLCSAHRCCFSVFKREKKKFLQFIGLIYAYQYNGFRSFLCFNIDI